MGNLLTDIMFWLEAGGALVAAVLLVSFARSAIRRWRALDGTWKPRFALAGSLFGTGISALFLLVLGFSAVYVFYGTWGLSSLEGKPAPELAFLGLPDETPANLAEHRGDVVIVNLWATWCPPCVHEMPELDRLQETYRDQGLLVLQISDEGPETINGYLRDSPMSTRHGFVKPFPWPTYARPTTWIVDREGVVRDILVGSRSFDQLEDAVRDYL